MYAKDIQNKIDISEQMFGLLLEIVCVCVCVWVCVCVCVCVSANVVAVLVRSTGREGRRYIRYYLYEQEERTDLYEQEERKDPPDTSRL